MKLRYGYIQDEMKTNFNKNKLMHHSKWRQNKITKYDLLSILILLSNHYRKCLTKIVEGTDVFAVLPTEYYKTFLYTITTCLNKFNGVTI